MIRATILLIFLIVAFADAAKNAAPIAVAPAATKSEKNPIQQLVNSVKDITSSQVTHENCEHFCFLSYYVYIFF